MSGYERVPLRPMELPPGFAERLRLAGVPVSAFGDLGTPYDDETALREGRERRDLVIGYLTFACLVGAFVVGLSYARRWTR